MRVVVTKFLLGLVLNFYWLPITQADFSNDTQYWWKTGIKQWESGRFGFAGDMEMRFSDGASELTTWRIKEKFLFSGWKNIDLGLNYRFENKRKKAGDPWDFEHRLELELNPHFQLSKQFQVTTRNRIEMRWKENRGSKPSHRFRHRVLISTRAKWLPGLEKVEMGNEFFYDFDADKYNQNRFYPLIAKFNLTPKVSIALFYMLLSKRDATSSGWRHAHVIGTSFQLNPFKKVSPR